MILTRLFNSHRNRALVLAAGLVFVLSQSINLQHTHNGDLNLQTDCHICLKLGSGGSATLAAAQTFAVAHPPQVYLVIAPQPARFVAQSPRSRSPPSVSV